MTLQAFKGGIWMPERIVTNDVTPLLNITLDTVNEVCGWVVRAPKTGNIDRIIFSTITVGTGATVDVRVEAVDTSTGLPDTSGTLLAANTNASHAIAGADDNDQHEVTLTAAAAVTVGDLFAVVITAPGSGTFDIQIATLGGDPVMDEPYCVTGTTASPAKTNRGPVLGFRYDDGTYWAPPGSWPVETISQFAVNTGTNPDEVGNKFTLPFPCKFNAVYIYADLAASTSYTLKVYDSGGSTLYSKVLDTDANFDFTDGGIVVPITEQEIAANSMFRVTVTPDAATSLEFLYLQMESASYLDMLDGGQNIHCCVRQDAGSWDDTTHVAKRMFISVRLSAFDDGAGGGGGLAVGALTGSVVH